jgi:hypothetical protein
MGRAWIEITPYLTEDLAGKGTLDLFDSWELIDPPGHSHGAGKPTQPARLL